jgi:hypothetical protein
MCTNLATKNIIEYSGMYYGTHHGGLKCMFANRTYLQLDDGACDDEDYKQNLVHKVSIVDIGGFMTMDEDSCFNNVNVPKGSSAPMDQTLACLHEIMVKIAIECTISASVELCNHATSLLQGIGSNIHHLHLVQVNKSMHLRMVFRWVDDGFGNSINWMKDWHETMMEHLDTRKKRIKK